MPNRSNYGQNSQSAYRLKEMYNVQNPDGVVVDPTPITAGEDIIVFYNGLLPKSGAQEAYLHCGFGAATKWNAVQDMKMEKTGWGFVKSLAMPDTSTHFNFCFHDSAQNWDNNAGSNWSFNVHNGSLHNH